MGNKFVAIWAVSLFIGCCAEACSGGGNHGKSEPRRLEDLLKGSQVPLFERLPDLMERQSTRRVEETRQCSFACETKVGRYPSFDVKTQGWGSGMMEAASRTQWAVKMAVKGDG